eukprot:5794387-Heterocapsa_arctica.AAC.1
MKQARSNDPHSCVVPMGTEFFNNGELRELLALSAQGRKDLSHYTITEYTPTELMNLVIAWKSAPASCIQAVE